MYKSSIKPYVFLILLMVFLDQITKSYFVDHFFTEPEGRISVFPGLNFVNVWNEGISFGMFSDFEYANIAFLTLSLLIVVFLSFLLFKEKTRVYSFGYTFVMGGALGNIIDRIRYDAVYDFIDVYVYQYHWPTFNIADSFVCIGVFLLIVHSFKLKN